MLAFKFFVFLNILIFLTDRLKKVRKEPTAKNKLAVAVSFVLFLFGVIMLMDAFM